MDITKARSRIEFNKRVRDLVSRDNNQLKSKCDKIDKQLADRMAEIHHMKEKVRHSMRSLEKDRLLVQKKAGSRKDNDNYGGAPLRKISGAPSKNNSGAPPELLGGASPTKHSSTSPGLIRKDLLETSLKSPIASKVYSQYEKNPSIKDPSIYHMSHSSTSRFRRASAPITIPRPAHPHRKRCDNSERKSSKNDDLHEGNSKSPNKWTLGIPGSDFTKRRSSSPMSRSQPGSPASLRDSRTGFTGFALSSSFPKELCSSETRRKLSVDNMRMSASSPRVYIHRKSTDDSCSFRDERKQSEKFRKDYDFSPIGSRVNLCENRPRSVSLAHFSKENTRKLSGAGPKGQLFRTRSSSLPDLLGLGYPKGLGNKRESMYPTKNLNVEDKLLTTQSQLSRSFEQLKDCRYLRSKEQDRDVTS